MAWGTAQSSHMLIASTHASDDSGVHRMFDVNHGSSIVKFDASEAGQKLAVDDTGGQLAIAVEGPSNCCSLRFYDIQHRNKHTIHKVALEPFSSRPGAPSEFEDSREINDVVFSQDSLYLAVARGDNTLHIYDTRKLGSGPVDVFEHNAEVSVGDTYGVVQAQWVEGTHQERGILSGGADGCVRLWDVRKAAGDSRNGEVVAQCSDDIGCFSLGNTSQNEWPLVVCSLNSPIHSGECSGKVTIFGGAVHG
ncbi:hypothetical protein B0H21DRAFT_778900 [Amylocystis lapponica]|nr:hypothetical protein B0H21DRAFT_778900 [Amylocystis lapponica]